MENPELKFLPRKKSPFRIAMKVIFWMVFSFFLILFGLVIAGVMYEKEIKSSIIEKLNRNLKAEIRVNPDNINLTLIRSFPNAAIQFKDVTVFEAWDKPNKDTLAHAGLISLEFSWYDLFGKSISVNMIQLQHMFVNAKVDKFGKENYIIWQENTQDTSNSKINFDLKHVVLKEVKFSYRNRKQKIRVECEARQSFFSGSFHEANYKLTSSGDLFVNHIEFDKRNSFQDKNIKYDLAVNVTPEGYTIKSAQVQINALNLEAQGYFKKLDSLLLTELSCKGKNVDIRSALSLLPAMEQERIQSYESDGTFYFDAEIDGAINRPATLEISAKFGITNASVIQRSTGIKLSRVNLTGMYEKIHGHPEVLHLKGISADLLGDQFSAECKLTGFDDPHIFLEGKGSLKLANALQFFPVDTIQKIEGRTEFDVHIDGKASELQRNFGSEDNQSFGSIVFSDVVVGFKGDPTDIQIPYGEIKLQQNQILINKFSFARATSDIALSGSVNDFFPWLFNKGKTLSVTANAVSKQLSADEFLGISSGKSSGGGFSISDKIDLVLDLHAAKLTLGKFKAESVKGTVKINNQRVLAESLTFSTMNGDVVMSGVIDARDTSQIKISGAANLVSINVQDMFFQLNNFSQKAIEDKNIRGTTNATIEFSSKWNSEFKPDLSSIQAVADILIEKGELIDYKPLESLAKFVELKELKHIRFSDLKSRIEIRDRTIFLPRTVINSSVMNLEIFGWHKFSNEIEYHIRMLLSEVLAKRPGKNKQLDEELAEVESDPENKRSVFLLMTGTTDNPVIKYDRKGMKSKIREDIKEEKQNMKKILNEEFGWFKKDSTIRQKKKEEREQKLQIEFGDKKPAKKKTLEKEKAVEDDDF